MVDVKSLTANAEAERSNRYIGQQTFAEQFEINFPLNTLNELHEFDKKLNTEEECRQRFVSLHKIITIS